MSFPHVVPSTTIETDHPLAAEVLTPAALDLIARLTRAHAVTLRELLRRRAEPVALTPPLTATGEWQVRPAPADLADRRVEITGPAEPKMMISALNSGAKVFMCDLEDALSPTWANILGGHAAIAAASRQELTFTRDDGSVDTVGADPATLTIRPRGLHLPETRVSVDGRPVPAAIFDLALLVTHAAPGLLAGGSGLYLYLPKLQSRHEAEWWDAVIADAERRTGLPHRSTRVTVLVEHLATAFQMEEVLFALRDRITGLNAGRWDYLFSFIKVLPEQVLPDRTSVTMAAPFMSAYARQLVEVCHRRGAHAIGGMSAFVPSRADAAATERAFANVLADKQREAGLGYDGTWVAHPDLVPVARQAFDEILGSSPDQRDVVVPAVPWEDLTVPAEGACTRAGLVADLRVALLYVSAWLGGRGAVAIDSLMEDAATAEIARCQVWQWIARGVVLEDGALVTAALVSEELDRLVSELDGVEQAAEVVRATVLVDELPEFLTLVALPLLD